MLKRRLIPVLFLQNGFMVRSEIFSVHQVIGHPVLHVERLNQWDVDELILLDITKGDADFSIRRDEHRHGGADDLLGFIGNIAATCHIPLTFGGRIRSLDDVRVRIQSGADKVTLNSAVSETPALIADAAREFGSQAIVVSVDYRIVDTRPRVFTHHASRDTGQDPVAWSRAAQECGAGEIFLNSVDRDGTAQGYDLEVIDETANAVGIPVIACGGAGHQSHFLKCFAETAAAAVAAGNIFHFTENAYPRAKTALRANGADVR